MYTLRIIDKNGREDNYWLGNRYQLIEKSKSPDEFERSKEFCKFTDGKLEKTFAFVVANNDIYPIRDTCYNYIMTESGKTFSTLKRN